MSKRAVQRLAMSICYILCVLFLGQIIVFADEAEPVWTTLASLSESHGSYQTEVIDGKIYAIGGHSGSSLTDSIEVYDPISNEWKSLASMITARMEFQTEVIDGKIYAIGGSNLSVSRLDTTEVYDPTTNKWTQLASMPTARSLFQTEVIDGKIYAIGGYKGDNINSNTTEVYDPTTNKWIVLAPMHTVRSDFQTEVIDGKIYAFSGANTPTTEVYDPTTNKWTELAPLSKRRSMFQTEVIDGKIYAIGGYIGSNTIEVYDPTVNKWETLAPMSWDRYNFQTKVMNGKIYAMGGYANGAPTNTVEVYDPTTNKWTSLAPMSLNRVRFQTELIDGKIYAIGGSSTSSMEVYAINNSSVRQLKATGGDSKVDLTWNAVTDATSYTVKRSTTAGGPYESISTDVTGTTYTDTNVTNGTNYYYIITAIVAGRESGNSNEASATPEASQTPPETEAKLKVVLEVAELLRLSVDDNLNVNTQMSWTSSEPTVATVNEKGIVTALAPGNTVITVKSADGSYTDYINVLVVENADDYRLAIDLKVGETARLTADDFTNTANITWAPMDSSIANVTTKGKVTALSKGLVLISAKDADGNIIGRVYVRVRE